MWNKFFIFLIFFCVLSGCSEKEEESNKIQTSNNKFQQNIINEEEKINKETLNNYNCSFTRTYRIVSKLDGYQSATGTFDYIVVDTFQSFQPVIISIPVGKKEKLEENKYYEFVYTLKGFGTIQNFSDVDQYLESTTMENETGVSSDVKVELEINSTDRQGLEQLNESICGS